MLHVLIEHAVPGPHAVPHAPQFALLVARFVSQPFVRMPSQLPQPAAQLAMPHVPLVHDATPFAGVGHTFPQAPHVFTDVFRFDSQPLAMVPSQFAQPALHVPMLQAPPLQTAVAFAGGAQTCPHIPHDVSVVLNAVSHPLLALESQSP